MPDIKSTYRKLIEQYEDDTHAAADVAEADALLSSLIDELYQESADYWYSSNC